MKYAVIVVGSHHAGKSRVIREHFKPLIGLGENQRTFHNGYVLSQSLEEKFGYVLSQSLEEKGIQSVKRFLDRYKGFKYLVCAARPEDESPSYQKQIERELRGHGFNVSVVSIVKSNKNSYYVTKGREILSALNINTSTNGTP